MRVWAILAVCLALAGAAAAVPLRRDTWQQDGVREFARRVAPASAGADPYNCKNLTFAQRVDHFDRSNQRTFQQRYYLCDGMWRNRAPGSREPLFVYFGEAGRCIACAISVPPGFPSASISVHCPCSCLEVLVIVKPETSPQCLCRWRVTPRWSLPQHFHGPSARRGRPAAVCGAPLLREEQPVWA